MKKWRNKVRVVVHETPPMWSELQPFVQSEIKKKDWPYKIIRGELESESIKLRHRDFIILPDVENTESMHYLVLFTDTSLTCIRSLRACHLPLLQQVIDSVQSVLPKQGLMMYFHYPPSVWQLHLHVVCSKDGLRTTNDMQKVHFIQDIMSNIQLCANYYTQACITYVLPNYHDIAAITGKSLSSRDQEQKFEVGFARF